MGSKLCTYWDRTVHWIISKQAALEKRLSAEEFM